MEKGEIIYSREKNNIKHSVYFLHLFHWIIGLLMLFSDNVCENEIKVTAYLKRKKTNYVLRFFQMSSL